MRVARAVLGAEGAGISSMPGHGSYVSGMSVNSANGQLICCDGSGRVLAWDAAAATAREVTGKNPKIFACSATSPSAPVAFCGTGDNKVRADLSPPPCSFARCTCWAGYRVHEGSLSTSM